MSHFSRGFCAALALLIAGVGCARHERGGVNGIPNQAPLVSLVAAKAGAAGNVSFDLRWSAHDPDGQVDHFLVTNDLRSLSPQGAGWLRSPERSKFVRAARAFPLAAPATPATSTTSAAEPQIFSVRAVDDHGAVSEPATFAAFGENIAPSVQIVMPRPSDQVRSFVPPTFRIRWQGIDPDGSTGRPTKYKTRLLHRDDPEFLLTLTDPDSLRRLHAPAFASWDSLPGDSTGMRLEYLDMSAEYIFVIVAIDEDGGYSPFLMRDTNVLLMRVVSAGGPTLGLWLLSPIFRTNSVGLRSPALGITCRLDRPLAIEWFKGTPGDIDPMFGSWATGVVSYRWALDPDTLEVPENTAPSPAWTPWHPETRSVVLGPLPGESAQRPHRFVVEVTDELGFFARAIVILHPLAPPRNRSLLIVNDTRFRPDGASHQPIAGTAWPWAAELDTFLFARGHVPWRFYPEGTLSTPGIFAGFDFDTIGTRTGSVNLSVPIRVLNQYRHVVWITDEGAANSRTSPSSFLLYMSTASYHSLAEYVRGGGQLWLVGGGAGTAATRAFNELANDIGGPVYSNDRELRPGRLMFDHARWRSEFRTGKSPGAVIHRGGDWIGSVAALSGMDMTRLPETLEVRDPESDPLPPLRETVPSAFYDVVPHLEWLSQPNVVSVDGGDPPEAVRRAHLDTLMTATLSAPFAGTHPSMTVASGPKGGRVIFSGFDLWSWRRSQCALLVDGVLGGIWGMERQPTTPAAMKRSAGLSPSAPRILAGNRQR